MIAKGSRPFARLTLSAPVAFTDGNEINIPFDTSTLSDSFGRLSVVPGFSGNVFACQYGVYFAQLQVEVNVSAVQIRSSITCQSGVALDISHGIAQNTFSNQYMNLMLNANRINTELRYPNTPIAYPIVINCSIAVFGGGAGNIVSANGRTALLIQQLSTY